MNESPRVSLSPWLVVQAVWRRWVSWAWDNPSAEQDARAILSAPKLGSWLGLEILLLCAGALSAFVLLPSEASEFHQAMIQAGTGQYLTSASLITLTAFVTLVVPLRAVGLLEGPRWRGYMDQVVTTGITPLRYFAGKWAVSQTFFLGLLVASLPLTVLYGLLGGATVGRTLAAYGLIYAYCNLLLLVSMALGVLLHEVAALIGVWHLFAALTLLDYVPAPSALAAFTPHRFLIQPFVEALAGSGAGSALELYGDAHVFGLTVPWAVWALGLWAAWSGLACVTLCLGPLHRFLPGTNNFGAVVLPGDAKRLFFRRLRPLLTRRVELAFLFENRGPLLVRWTLPARALQILAGFCLCAVPLVGLVYDASVIAETPNYAVLLGFETGMLVVLLLGLLYALATGRSDVGHGFALTPRLRLPILWFDVGVFVVACALLIGVHALAVAGAWPELSLDSRLARHSSIGGGSEFLARSALHLAVLVTTAFLAFLVGKVAACRVLSQDVAYLISLVYLAALIGVPVLFLGAAEAVRHADDRALHALVRPLLVFAQASPALPLIMGGEHPPASWGPMNHWLLTDAFWLWSGVQALLLSVATLTSNLTSFREARLIVGELPPSGPACPGCGCEVAAPLGWSWWGGALVPLLLGYLRCVECNREFHPRSGARSAALVAGVFLGRLVLSVSVVVGVVVWVVMAVRL